MESKNYLTAAARLEIPVEQCVAVEDAPVGVRSAKAAHMACIGLVTHGIDPADLAEADLIIESLREFTPELLRQWPLPKPSSSKKARGQVVVIGGAGRTPGGVALAGLAALRVGAGHVQLAVAASVAPALAAGFPEAGVIGLLEDETGTVLGEQRTTQLERLVQARVLPQRFLDGGASRSELTRRRGPQSAAPRDRGASGNAVERLLAEGLSGDWHPVADWAVIGCGSRRTSSESKRCRRFKRWHKAAATQPSSVLAGCHCAAATRKAVAAVSRSSSERSWSRTKKLALIRTMNPQWKDLAAEFFGTARMEIPRAAPSE